MEGCREGWEEGGRQDALYTWDIETLGGLAVKGDTLRDGNRQAPHPTGYPDFY